MAARSSSVNPLDFLLIAVVLLVDFCVAFFALIVPPVPTPPYSSTAARSSSGSGECRMRTLRGRPLHHAQPPARAGRAAGGIRRDRTMISLADFSLARLLGSGCRPDPGT